MKIKIAVLGLVLLLGACTPSRQVQHANFTLVEPPQGVQDISPMPWTLIWPSHSGLSAIYRTGEDTREYFFINLTDFSVQELEFQTPHKCSTKWYGNFSLLPNGRLGLELICFGFTPDAGSDNQREAIFLLVYDFFTQETQELVEGPLPTIRGLRDYAWNPDITSGVHATSDGLSGTLFWISPSGYEPIETALIQGDRNWDMAELFHGVTDVRGIAKSPTWSPHDQYFVFFGGVFHEDTFGAAKLGARLSLFMMSPDTQPVELEDGFVTPGETAWSPNGDWIAFISQIGYYSNNANAEKLWLYSVNDGNLIEIAEGRHDGLVWDPTGKFLAASFCIPSPNFCEEAEIRVYDVSEIVGDK